MHSLICMRTVVKERRREITYFWDSQKKVSTNSLKAAELRFHWCARTKRTEIGGKSLLHFFFLTFVPLLFSVSSSITCFCPFIPFTPLYSPHPETPQSEYG